MPNKFAQKGISIIEIVIAIAVLSLIGASLISLMGQITSVNNAAVLKSRATGYAEQGLEQVRGYRSTNGAGYLGLAAKGGNGSGVTCYGEVVTWTGPTNLCNTSCTPLPGSQISGTNLYRWIRVSTTPNVNVKVESTVVWLEKNQCRNTQLVEYFYDY